jgi:hypothetical protein
MTMLKCIFAIAAVAGSAATGTGAEPLARLRARGVQFEDTAGKAVYPRGVNLGGWFVQEMWMTPWAQDPPEGSDFHKIVDDAGLWALLKQRFGSAGAQEVKDAWRDAWIQRSDFDRIKAAGFNHVRLPFLYDLLEEPHGMQRLRTAVKWANDAGLYVVLDMHGVPGRQSMDHTTGEAGVNRFFFEPQNVEKAEKVWAAVAKEFGSNPGVAAFDLINEPTGAPNPATLHLVYNRLYQAVRRVAPSTIVIIDDGYKGFDTTPHANVAGWTNVAYSLHFYNFDAKSAEEQLSSLTNRLPRTLELRGYRNAPVYVGEFNIEPHGTAIVMADYIRNLSSNGLGWAIWTYKTVAVGGPMGFWGLYSKHSPADALNPFTDSIAELKAKIEQVRTERLEPAADLLPVFRAAVGSGAAK